ncbi:ATP-binding protein [Pedobacter sp. MW01-1-1]|uniref:ATP-binding protein n=1 Tax=Pedobacter sp. MW01-1-1 TaxID=3383027 RepID=UPI003FED6405
MKLSFGVRIRVLLLILGCCLIITSISLNIFTPKSEILERDAKEVNENLQEKEKMVYDFLANPKLVEEAKTYQTNTEKALYFIENYRVKEGINLFTYYKGTLQYWSTFHLSDIDPYSLRFGTSVIQLGNGWYEVIRSSHGDYDFVFVISIKSHYPIKENEYFKNDINPFLSDSKLLTFASFTDKNVYPIKSIDGRFLFGLKINFAQFENYYTKTQLWLFVAGMICICMFMNSLARFLVRLNHVMLATALLVVFFLTARLTDLEYGWFNQRFTLALFDPKVYADEIMPSLGDFFLNVFSLTWVLMFMFNHRKLYRFGRFIRESKFIGIVIHFVFLLLLGGLVIYSDDAFAGLIKNSKINFDIINILKLSGTSWVGIVILCLVWFILYLIALISASLTLQLNVTNKERLIIFFVYLGGILLYKIFHNFSIFFAVYGLLLFLVVRAVYITDKRVRIDLFAIGFFFLAFNTSIKYIKYKEFKERDLRIQLASKLPSSEDPNAIIALSTLETNLIKDQQLINYFLRGDKNNYVALKNYVKDYIDGYLTRYDYHIYPFNTQGKLIGGTTKQSLSAYKRTVESGSIKTEAAHYFYQVNNTFGYQDYFGMIPILDNGNLLGTLVIELSSKPYNYNNKLPDLLGDQKADNYNEFKDYSVALYNNNVLVNQTGNYTYPVSGKAFKNEGFINSTGLAVGYSHLVFSPSYNKKVVISKQKADYVERLAALSFFFLVFIVFSILLFGIVWLIRALEDDKVSWFNINRSLMVNESKILYKTRIQVSIVLSVVATLIIVGWVTYYYMDNEYRGQQEDAIKDKVKKVQQNFQKQFVNIDTISNNEELISDFNNFADLNNVDLNLYDTNGDLLMTTYPKLFNYKIVGKKMPPKAYVSMHNLQRSEYINPLEQIGGLIYSAAYVPIKNSQNVTVRYIGLPNYLNETEYEDKIALFVSNLINIYALVFVAIGVLAVFLANQITHPLTFIQENISKIKIGEKNEPIFWRRHDEIGSLIRAYNSMIAALDESASKLAKSERENAWREMAKQVAHEIKNPLTPLKLGVQLLEKSWKEKDPNFEVKFNKFSKSFIEQIESLSKIASEFSNFAKMPDTNLEKASIISVIEQAIDVFKNTENVEISVLNKTTFHSEIMIDRDQLLRSFNNLFKNAIEAKEDNRPCVIETILYNDDKMVYIEVKDNGKGIPLNQRDKIFVPNFTTKSSGTGLGLAFVKQATENAGGSISFSSVAGSGTSFYLSFPLPT